MKIEIQRTETVEVEYLKVIANVRYWEDAAVNGLIDEDGSLIPCRDGDSWAPLIDLETGIIHDWPKDTIADLHYKVCDASTYTLLDASMNKIVSKDGYVPDVMSPGGPGYGDYIIMHIGPDGHIANWDGADLDDIIRQGAVA